MWNWASACHAQVRISRLSCDNLALIVSEIFLRHGERYRSCLFLDFITSSGSPSIATSTIDDGSFMDSFAAKLINFTATHSNATFTGPLDFLHGRMSLVKAHSKEHRLHQDPSPNSHLEYVSGINTADFFTTPRLASLDTTHLSWEIRSLSCGPQARHASCIQHNIGPPDSLDSTLRTTTICSWFPRVGLKTTHSQAVILVRMHPLWESMLLYVNSMHSIDLIFMADLGTFRSTISRTICSLLSIALRAICQKVSIWIWTIPMEFRKYVPTKWLLSAHRNSVAFSPLKSGTASSIRLIYVTMVALVWISFCLTKRQSLIRHEQYGNPVGRVSGVIPLVRESTY